MGIPSLIRVIGACTVTSLSVNNQSDCFSCHDLISGFYRQIQVQFLKSMKWSRFYGSLKVHTFNDSSGIIHFRSDIGMTWYGH